MPAFRGLLLARAAAACIGAAECPTADGGGMDRLKSAVRELAGKPGTHPEADHPILRAGRELVLNLLRAAGSGSQRDNRQSKGSGPQGGGAERDPLLFLAC